MPLRFAFGAERADGQIGRRRFSNEGSARAQIGGYHIFWRKEMKNFVMNFLQEESGQDLIEYTLLMAFIALASAAIFISAGGSAATIWTNASSNLSAGASQGSS